VDRTAESLNVLAKQLYKKYWSLNLDIPIIINPKMRKWSARYMKEYIYADEKKVGIKGKSIEVSKFAVENYSNDGLIDLLKHELCHHACLSQNKPYTDGSHCFESELKRIDASSHSHTSEELIARGYVARKKGK
jgi:SprT-like protein